MPRYGGSLAFEAAMNESPYSQYDSGEDGMFEECRSCRFHRPHGVDRTCVFHRLALLVGITLTVLQVPNGWLFGLLAGVLDAFPFIGTGIVLVPLTIWLFLKGQLIQAVFCLVLYGVCALVRELLEPKLIGEKVGIYPIVLFASVFIGMQLFGVSGIIKGPLSIVIIYEIRKVLLAKDE